MGNVLGWKEDPEIDEIFDNLKEESTNEEQKEQIITNKRKVKKALRTLHHRICNDQIINYFKVTKDDLDDILKIFIRVNSGGTQLSRTDLLFSTIVATWEDGRDEIEAFLKEINSKGDGFWFNNDFLMRSCLVLSDLPVLFKVNSFRSENVELIKRNWNKIKESISRTVDFLTALGFSGSVLTSQNAIIVIAYHFMKGGDFSQSSKEGLRKYLLFALLKNIYGGQGDQVISNLRNALRIKNADNTYSLKNHHFPIEDFLKLSLPANKSLAISTEDIEEFMNYRKGPNSFFVLSLLYPHLKYNEIHFHQDHIHPDSKFTEAKMKAVGIPEEHWEEWKQIKDTVPNLQLMEGRQNGSKNASTFEEWIKGSDVSGKKNITDLHKFCADNYIPDDVSFSFSSFGIFYNRRKEILIEELIRVLRIESKEAIMVK